MAVLFNRRHFLGLGATSLMAPLLCPSVEAKSAPSYMLCAKDLEGYAAYEVDANGHIIGSRQALPARGHGIASVTPDGAPPTVAVFSRRPGRYILINGHLIVVPPEDSQLNGHGVFSQDGQYLYATETDLKTSEGLIGVYARSENWQRVDAFLTQGLDPHEVILHPNGKHLIVANGGRLTHPDFPRHHLNPGEISPSLVTLDRKTGALIHKGRHPSLEKMVSVRHLAYAHGTTWWAGQLEDAAPLGTPIMGTYDPYHDLQLLDSPTSYHMGRYLGSIHSSEVGIIVTNPRANLAVQIQPSSQDVTTQWALPDVCAVAGDLPIFATGTGHIGPAEQKQHHPHIKWDNHMRQIS